jgi:AcrR family transcriptional regulator
VDHEERRTDLARAVLRVVGRGGVQALTTRAVAAEAGWSTGVIAHYYANRDELLLSAFGLVAKDAGARIRTKLASETDPIRRVWIALSEGAPLDDQRRAEARVWFAFLGLVAGDSTLAENAAARYDGWLALLSDQLLETGMTRHHAMKAARRLLAFLDGLTLQMLMDPRAFSATQLERELRSYIDTVVR